MTQPQHLSYMVMRRPLSVDGQPAGDWEWWHWLEPAPGGNFDSMEAAEYQFRLRHSSAEWEMQIFDIMARRVK